jgi:hypothetical protein
MARKFKTVDYEAVIELTITIGACLAARSPGSLCD